jgi:cobalt transporter subunit CbtB
MMTTLNQTTAKSDTGLMSILFVALVGATMVFTVGLAQSQTLHDAAHDVRHATGFPCH